MFEEQFKGKTVLVTGGTGSIGSELVKQLFNYHPRQVRVLSRDESRQYDLVERLRYPKNLRLLIGDIRDADRIEFAMREVDIVLHAAALKHVPFCEYNPFEAVKTNIMGSQNVINAALKTGVKKVVAISTDKAVFPSNVMGASKLMMEKLFVNANFYAGKTATRFSCVRFGNVAWARGSVLPLWEKQAATDRRIRVTDGTMTRFLMSKEQAVQLVLKSVALSQMGEIFIFKMPSIKLSQLAAIFAKKYYPKEKISIDIVGTRLGEKMHEELLDSTDLTKEILHNKEMFIVLPKTDIYTLTLEPKSYPGFIRLRKRSSFSSKTMQDPKLIEKII